MSGGDSAGDPAWLHTHGHAPNPVAPDGDGSFRLGDEPHTRLITLDMLQALPYTEVGGCFIVSTGHGTSGPFRFGGVRLLDLLAHTLPGERQARAVDVESADGFGARLPTGELGSERPPLLAWMRDGVPLARRDGLVRLIVPSETDDALRQVKWVARITPAP
jgi:hypothetical protein